MKKRLFLSYLFPIILMEAICLWILLGIRGEWLPEVAGMTPFYISKLFVSQTISTGLDGIINLCSAALCACMASPTLGAILLTQILVVTPLLLQRAAKDIDWIKPLCWLPSFICLAKFVEHGYDIYLDKNTSSLLSPVIYAFATALIACLVRVGHDLFHKNDSATSAKRHVILSVVSAITIAAGGYYAYSKAFKDRNYADILRMKQAVERNDWEGVLDISANHPADITSTRLQVLYTRLALYKLGRSGNDTFSYPDGDADYAADTPNQYMRLIAGPQIYYHYGKANFAYRWCMEDMVEYGMRPQYLLQMAKCAKINGEDRLAHKYAKQLNANPFYNIDIDKDFNDEQAAITPLMQYNSVLDGDGGHIEAYLLNSYATMDGGTREMVRLSLDCCLILKDIPDFWPLFIKMMPVWMNEEGGRIPRHYQEAAMLFARLQGNVDLSQVPLDGDIQNRFEQLINESAQNSQMGDEYNARALRPAYGNTYWYYYFFTTGLKTN